MGENEKNFIQYVGRVLFPRNPADLRSTTQCPACLTVLNSSVCQACQLDLNHPSAVQLAAVSNKAADALDERLELIGQIRFETDQLLAARAAAAAAPAATVARPPVPAPPVASPAVDPPAAPHIAQPVAQPVAQPTASPVAGPAAPRRSSVQVLLVVVGVSLLSIFAIFGLVFAFITYGVAVRSVIIGAITVASFIAASLLHRRKLTATGEGIAALAVVLVVLDLWAVRVNDFFGLAASTEAAYWGAALLLASLGFLLWGRLSGIRVPNIAAHAALVPAVGLLVSGILDGASLDWGSHLLITGLAAATAGLVHRLTLTGGAGAVERVLILTASAIAILVAFVAAWAAIPESDWGASLALAAVALVTLAHSHAAGTLGGASVGWKVAGALFAAPGALSAAFATAAFAPRVDDDMLMMVAPAAGAVIVALVFEAVWRRSRNALMAPAMLTGAIAAGSVAIVATLVPLVAAMEPFVLALSGAVFAQSFEAFEVLAVPSSLATQGLIGAAVATALAASGWAALGVLSRRAHLLLYLVALLAILAVPQLRLLLPVALGYAALAALSLAVMLRGKTQLPGRYRPPLIAVLAVAVLVSNAIGWAATELWWATTASTVLIALATRWLVGNAAARSALLGFALVVVLAAVARLGDAFAAQGGPPVYAVTAVVAGTLIALASFTIPRVTASDRRVAFWIAALWTLAALVDTVRGVGDEGLLTGWGSAVAAVAVIVGLLLWSIAPGTRPFIPERVVAGLLTGGTAAWGTASAATAIGLPDDGRQLAPLIALVAVAGGALAAGLARPGYRLRWTFDAGAAAIALPLIAVMIVRPFFWLALLLGAVGLLLVATSRDGIVGSASGRKYFGWAALALATGALWLRLADSAITEPEPYVLPLAGALLIIGILARRFGATTELRPSRGAPILLLSGLLVAIVPLALASAEGPLTRPLIVGGASALLLLVGTLARENADVQPYLDSAAIAGLAGVVLVSGTRTLHELLTASGTVNTQLEAWFFPAAIVMVAAAIGLARSRGGGARPQLGLALVATGIVAVGIVEMLAADATALGTLRAVGLVLLLCAVHTLAFWADRAPFSRLIAWLALATATLAGGVFVLQGITDPFEYATVPIGLALLASGILALSTKPAARTWPWLGPGMLVLLLPSLLSLYADDPVWRIVGVGVVATTAIVVGAVRRLQAPFLIGVVALLVHLVTQLWPGIALVYESVQWWLWLGLAGLLLVVLAARYEHRMRNLRSVAMRIAALR